MPELGKTTSPEAALKQFQTGNQIVFDITVGLIVSLFIYVLVVRLPEHSKRKRVQRNLKRQYESFKEDCIQIFLWAIQHPADSELIEKLKDREHFKQFFHEKVSEHQTRWDAVLNGLDEYKFKSLILELEILMHEVQFTLNAIDVAHPEAFAFLKRLTQVLYRNQRLSPEYDDEKQLSRFMWSVHTGWSVSEGYTGRDVVAEMIDAI